MTRWKKDETNFRVAVSNTSQFSKLCRIPPRVLEVLENPEHIEFVIKGKKVEVQAIE